MNLICDNFFEKKYERRIESFEKETLFGIFEIIDRMHKHSIEDYKNVISCVFDEDILSDHKFEKVYSEQFHLMFDHISEEFEDRLINLKHELMKRLDIKKRDIKKLQVITEENESENECDNKSENESDNKSDNESENECDNKSENECYNESLKSPPFITIGKYKLFKNSPFKNSSETKLDEVFQKAQLMRHINTVKELK